MHAFPLIIGAILFIPRSEEPPSATSTEKPAALVAMERARLALRTARVEWSETGGPRDGGRERFYTSRCAGEDFIVVERGDDEGVLYRNREGNPETRLSFPGPIQHLVRPGKEIWRHSEFDTSASVFLEKEIPWTERVYPNWDVRALGATPWTPPQGGSGVSDALRLLRAVKEVPATYRSEKVGHLHKVVANLGEGWSHEYLIDPDRGWNPTRMDIKHEGTDSTRYPSVHIKLNKFGETWFPREVSAFSRNRTEPDRVIRVLSASFNQEDHAKELSVRDIGIDVGTNISVRHPPNSKRAYDPDKDLLTWDGNKLIPYSEFARMIKSGKIEYGPGFRKASQRLKKRNKEKRQRARQLPQPPDSGRPTIRAYEHSERWDGWFERVALVCGLSDIQKNSGQAILKELRKRVAEKEKSLKAAYPTNYADAVDRVHAEHFTELVRRVAAIMTPEQIPPLEKLVGQPELWRPKKDPATDHPGGKSTSGDP